jgi:long-chain acyl-CoA synthetase
MDNLREVRPHFITAVPLIIERLAAQIMANARQGSFFRKKLMNWAIHLGKNYHDGKRQPFVYWLRLGLARVLVFNRWRRMFGGRIEGIIVGAAALNPELGRLFSAAQLKVREGYGLTETSPVIAFNRFEPGGARFGTVGMPIPGVEVRIIDPDEEGAGEVQVKGPNVMLGYYQQPDSSRKVMTQDGWFRTGDVGRWEHKRFLQLKGRKDDMFKTGAGKFIAPEVVEKQLYNSMYISQCLVAGASRPAPFALIVPQFDHLEEWCKAQKVHWTAPQFMVLNPRVLRFFKQELECLNHHLPPYQQVRPFLLLHEPWTEQSGEMTPTMKLRRKRILDTHAKAINELYTIQS